MVGLNVLKTSSPFSSTTKSIHLATATTTTTKQPKTFSFPIVVSSVSHIIHYSPPTPYFKPHSSFSSSSSLELVTCSCIPSSGFHSSLRFPQGKRRFRCGVVVSMAAAPGSARKSEEEWRAILSPEQFRILRQKGTEYPGTGEYDKFFEEGTYACAGCGTPLYRSITKFNSGCGWPAFYEGLPGAISRHLDPDGVRVEITCTACGGHLGHVFKGEGFSTPTDERHCVNSISLKFVPANSNSSL